VLPLALRAAQPREAAEQPAAVEVGLDRPADDGTQRAAPALEALLVGADVGVEVALEEPVQRGALRAALCCASSPSTSYLSSSTCCAAT